MDDPSRHEVCRLCSQLFLPLIYADTYVCFSCTLARIRADVGPGEMASPTRQKWLLDLVNDKIKGV